MKETPLFMLAEFEESDAPLTPFSPVSKVRLGYMSGESSKTMTVDVATLDAQADNNGWKSVADCLTKFTGKFPNWCLVGWNLRNLDWPAVIANMVRCGCEFPDMMRLSMTRKWNDLPLVDLRNVVLQGGFSQEDISLASAAYFMFGGTDEDPMSDLVRLYRKYAKV